MLAAAAAITWSVLFALEADPDATLVAESVGRACPDPCAYAFGPDQAPAGLVIYPGAGVEAAAYAPLAADIANAGYLVTIQKAPFGLAILDADMAQVSIDAFGEVERWVVGGHSLGGAMAARFASESSQVAGLVLLAAYPEGGLDLSGSGLEVLAIYGDRDPLATPSDVLSAEPQLPSDAEFVAISGGNHAQFGSYGRQPRDAEAAITPEVQRRAVVESVVGLLDTVGEP